MTLPAAV
jgi:pantothenate kinase